MVERAGGADSAGPVFSAAELARYARDGFVVARKAADPATVARYAALARAELAAAADPLEYEADVAYPGAPAGRDAPGGGTVRRLLGACARNPAFREWAMSPAIALRVRQLLGPAVSASQAHHNCIMTKHPQWGSVTGWHQDIRYWSFERPELVSAWLALGRERPENGGLLLLPGTHQATLAPERFDPAKFLREDLPQNKALIDTRVPVELEAGDVLFFHCRLLHAAGGNRSAAVKFSLVFTYHAADNRPLSGTRSAELSELALP